MDTQLDSVVFGDSCGDPKQAYKVFEEFFLDPYRHIGHHGVDSDSGSRASLIPAVDTIEVLQQWEPLVSYPECCVGSEDGPKTSVHELSSLYKQPNISISFSVIIV